MNIRSVSSQNDGLFGPVAVRSEAAFDDFRALMSVVRLPQKLSVEVNRPTRRSLAL